ncbi:hypothetical protein R3P38DRAFT_1226573 [Favolaschia claudopus]|uniref:Uncharacterized protein n=1 Tax=Favolaschia claudopus TaxID=2862362 RepID=A0AAW0B1I7_9AGAR
MSGSDHPPLYSSLPPGSISCPTYSPRPGMDERTLQHSRPHVHPLGTGMCVKCVGGTTLVLLDQEENAEHPRIEEGSSIRGVVILENTENVLSVVLKVDGLLETLPFPASYMTVPLVSITNELYRHDSQPTACPSSLSFSHPFPSQFHYQQEIHSLPPTFHVAFNSLHFIKCAYQITVTVVSALHRRASFLTKSNQVCFEFTYRPRSRPSQPLLLNPSLVETVKSCPEEWVQCSQIVSISSLPVWCDLFLPSILVFCVEDPIPFHLQLSVPDGRQQLFRPNAHPLVKVHLLRKLEMNVGDRQAHRDIVLGEATLQRVPLGRDEDTQVVLGWEGEARCRDPDSVVGTFSCGNALSLTDLIVVEIFLPHETRRPSLTVPIKLTTHRWDSYF